MTAFRDKQLSLMRRMEASNTSGTGIPTIVPMRSDFQNDPQMALTCVTYIPETIAASIRNRIIEPLRHMEPDFYYYPDGALHLTVQNVRTIHDPPNFTARDVKRLQMLLSRVVPITPGPFRFMLRGLVSLPTSVSLIALGQPKYDRFVRHLRSELIDAGIPDDKTYFTDEIVFGNITVCRYTHKPSTGFRNMLSHLRNVSVGAFALDHMSLVTMNAGANPSKTRHFGTYRFM